MAFLFDVEAKKVSQAQHRQEARTAPPLGQDQREGRGKGKERAGTPAVGEGEDVQAVKKKSSVHGITHRVPVIYRSRPACMCLCTGTARCSGSVEEHHVLVVGNGSRASQ